MHINIYTYNRYVYTCIGCKVNSAHMCIYSYIYIHTHALSIYIHTYSACTADIVHIYPHTRARHTPIGCRGPTVPFLNCRTYLYVQVGGVWRRRRRERRGARGVGGVGGVRMEGDTALCSEWFTIVSQKLNKSITFVYFALYACICLYVCVCMYMRICMYIHIYAYMYVYACICIYVCIYIYMHICMCMHVYAYMYVYTYICIYVCVCM